MKADLSIDLKETHIKLYMRCNWYIGLRLTVCTEVILPLANRNQLMFAFTGNKICS